MNSLRNLSKHALSNAMLAIKKLLSGDGYKALVSMFFCDYQEHKRNCEKIWGSDGAAALYIPPKKYSFLEKVIARAPYGRLCNIADDEFCWYGHAPSILKFAGITQYPVRRTTAEHGNILSYRLPMENYDRYKNKLVLTFGQSRAEFLRSSYGINAEPIGPFIHYARAPIVSYRLSSLKKLLGRVVVHFPFFEDIVGSNQDRVAYSREDHRLCAQTLLQWKKDGLVDSIVICYRWIDTLQKCGVVEAYQGIDAIEACCGTILNPFYLDHLRLIIELSVCTTSNTVSTPLGYSIYLGKPHYIIGIGDLNSAHHKPNDPASTYLFKQLYATSAKASLDMPTGDLYTAIADSNGFTCVRTSPELGQLLLGAESC